MVLVFKGQWTEHCVVICFLRLRYIMGHGPENNLWFSINGMGWSVSCYLRAGRAAKVLARAISNAQRPHRLLLLQEIKSNSDSGSVFLHIFHFGSERKRTESCRSWLQHPGSVTTSFFNQRWPELLSQTPSLLLFPNFWNRIRVRRFFKLENSTPVQTLATRDYYYPVCWLDIRKDSEFAKLISNLNRIWIRISETLLSIFRRFTLEKSCTLHNHSFCILGSIFSAFCAMTSSLSMV